MTMIKFKNNNGVSRFTDRSPLFSDLFDDAFSNLFTLTPAFNKMNVPAVNISENNDNYKIDVAAPGLKKDDFKVNVENDVLTISTEKKEDTTESKEKFTRKEFSYSSFKHSFTLPELSDTEKINASYENGVMSITIPKKEEAKVKPVREIKIS